jgi:[CysO sulfur-carrier protein]-S-L-cysteine hydrolase
MKLLLPSAIMSQWTSALNAAGRREIGGVLLGELIKTDTFKISEITIQKKGGTFCHFVRDPKLHEKAIHRFFERTGHNYERFNYLGEWHSHPSFPTRPSTTDIRSMRRIIGEPNIGANFAALLIVKLKTRSDLEMSACVFRSGFPVQEIRVYREHLGKRIHDWRGMGRARVAKTRQTSVASNQ